MTLAKENQVQFAKYLQSNPQENLCIDLVVNVLTTGFWPNYKPFDLLLPAEMVREIISFFPFPVFLVTSQNISCADVIILLFFSFTG